MESFALYSLARQVVTLSEEMLDMANQSQWRSFEKHEKQRQKLLTKIFDTPDIAAQIPKIASFLQQVLEYDTESMRLGETARRETLKELLHIRSNVNAVGAYQQQSSFERPK